MKGTWVKGPNHALFVRIPIPAFAHPTEKPPLKYSSLLLLSSVYGRGCLSRPRRLIRPRKIVCLQLLLSWEIYFAFNRLCLTVKTIIIHEPNKLPRSYSPLLKHFIFCISTITKKLSIERFNCSSSSGNFREKHKFQNQLDVYFCYSL